MVSLMPRPDTVSKEKLITSNLRLVAGIALKYSKKSLQYMDLIQDGTIGLIKAIDKFDPSKGYRLNTYATWWIKREIIEAIKEKINMIKVPGYIFLIYKKMEKIAKKIVEAHGGKIDVESKYNEYTIFRFYIPEVKNGKHITS